MSVAFAQSPQYLLTEFTYDATNQKPLVFNRTLDIGSYSIIDFNLPFAYHFLISGKHVEFSIEYELAKWYFFRKGDKTYFDLIVNLYQKSSGGWEGGHVPETPGHATGIIRIILME
jgi:hypothetical protein